MNKYRKERYIRQIKNKKGWSFQVRYKNFKKSFSEDKYGDSRIAFNEAIKYRNSITFQDHQYLIPFNITIYDVMLESFEILVIRQKTRLNHISFFNRYIKDKILIQNFNESFVYEKLNALVEDYKNDIIRRVFNIFQRIDKTCLIKKYYDKSVMASIVCPQSHINTPKQFKEPINREQLNIIIQACKDLKNPHDQKYFPLILEFMYETGCRPCEVWPLTWEDITPTHISINKEVGSSNTQLETIRAPKTPLSNRLIPITPKIKTILKEAKNPSNLIFPNPKGNLYDTDSIGARIYKLSKKTKIPFHLYDLRHRFATDLTLNLVDDRTKMELMGHKNIKTTLDYARSNDTKKIEALTSRK